jgi:hypothetical protein
LRRVAIVAQNVAYAVLRDGSPRLARLAAVARGTLDFQRGRFGPGPA